MQKMKKLLLATAMAIAVTGVALAGAWPDVGDQFRTAEGTLLVVAKIIVRPDVDESLVCMHASGTRAEDTSCDWAKVGDLHGDWITYEGVPQHAGDDSDSTSLSGVKKIPPCDNEAVIETAKNTVKNSPTGKMTGLIAFALKDARELDYNAKADKRTCAATPMLASAG